MNKVELLGRLTADPIIRGLDSGVKVAQYTLAVNRRGVKKEGQPNVDFFNIVSWDKAGEFVEKYYKKGQQVVVVGRLQNKTWTDAAGTKRYATEVISEELHFADSKKDGESTGNIDSIPPIDQEDPNALPF